MLETLLGWLLSGIIDMLSVLIEQFMGLMVLDIQAFLYYVPGVGPLYYVIRGIALGLVVGIAIFNLLKFFAAPLSKVQENPFMVLVRTFFAVGMIYFGGYILELVIDLFKGPYSVLVTGYDFTVPTPNIWNGWLGTVPSAVGTVAIGEIGRLLLSLVIVISLGINILKLLLELIERYVMVCVMVYTAPLGWSTLASQGTISIFSRWLNMFFSQCIMMLISAWSVQVFMSILIESQATGIIVKGLFALAFARVAQRFDSYLQQLGLNPATTGGSMLDEIVAVGRTLKPKGKHKRSDDDTVLGGSGGTGETGKSTMSAAMGFGVGGAVFNMAKTGKGGFSAGKAASAAEGNPRTQTWLDGAKQGVHNIKNSVVPNRPDGTTYGQTQVDKAVSEARNGNRTAYDKLTPAEKNLADARAKARGEEPPKRKSTVGFFNTHLYPDELDLNATNNGLYIATDADNNRYIGGPEEKVREFCAGALTHDDITDTQADMVANTMASLPDSEITVPESAEPGPASEGKPSGQASPANNGSSRGSNDDRDGDTDDDEYTDTSLHTRAFAGAMIATGLTTDQDYRKAAAGTVCASEDFRKAVDDAHKGNERDIEREGGLEVNKTGWTASRNVDGGKELTFTYTTPPHVVRGSGQDIMEQKTYTGSIMNEKLYNARKKEDKNDPRVTSAVMHTGKGGQKYYTWCERKGG